MNEVNIDEMLVTSSSNCRLFHVLNKPMNNQTRERETTICKNEFFFAYSLYNSESNKYTQEIIEFEVLSKQCIYRTSNSLTLM